MAQDRQLHISDNMAGLVEGGMPATKGQTPQQNLNMSAAQHSFECSFSFVGARIF